MGSGGMSLVETVAAYRLFSGRTTVVNKFLGQVVESCKLISICIIFAIGATLCVASIDCVWTMYCLWMQQEQGNGWNRNNQKASSLRHRHGH